MEERISEPYRPSDVTPEHKRRTPPNLFEDIETYLRVKGRLEGLNEIRLYVQHLQKQRTVQAQKTMLKAPAGAPRAPAQNPLGSSFIAELQALIAMFPQYASQLNKILSDAESGTLTSQDLNNLNNIVNQVLSPQNLPNLTQSQLLKLQSILQGLVNAGTSESAALQQELDAINQQLSALNTTLSTLADITKLMQKLQSGTLSGSDWMKLMQDLEDLENEYNNVPPSVQTAIGKIFASIDNFTVQGPDGERWDFAQLFANYLMTEWTQQYPGVNPTKTQIAAYVKQRLQEMGGDTNSTFANDVLSQLNRDLISWPNAYDRSGINFNSPSSLMNWLATLNPVSFPTSILNLLESATNVVNSAITSTKQEQQNVNNYINMLSEVGNGLQQALTEVQQLLIWASSLPDAFAQAVLDHYMPGQEAYLRQLAEVLLFMNTGAQDFNTLMNDTLGFSDAGNNFDFSKWLAARGPNNDPSGNPYYTGTASSANNQVQGEMTQASQAIGQANQGINDAQSQLTQAENKTGPYANFTASQLTEIKSKLHAQIAGFRQAIVNLKEVYNSLSQIAGKFVPHYNTATPPVVDGFSLNDPNATTDIANINKYEGYAINGDPNAKPPGGLVQIASDITATQQSYANQSTNQQMYVQYTFTTLEQEWSVVTSALQSLNSMYMTIAQSIFKG